MESAQERGSVGGEVGWEQTLDVLLDDPACEDRDDIREVLHCVDAHQRARADDRKHDRGALRAPLRACEEEVLSCQRRADMESLDRAVVDGDSAIHEETTKRSLLVQEIAQRSTEGRGRRFIFPERSCPLQEPREDGRASFLPKRQSLCRAQIEFASFSLDAEEDLIRVDRQGSASITAVECLHEVSPRVHVASALDDALALERLVEDACGIGHRETFSEAEEVCRADGVSVGEARVTGGREEIESGVVVPDEAPQGAQLLLGLLVLALPAVLEERQRGAIEVKNLCVERLQLEGAPEGLEQLGSVADLIGEGGDREPDPESLESLDLPMKRKTVPVLVDQEVGDEARPETAAFDHLVASGSSNELRLFACVADELLPQVAPNDDLSRDELENLGHVVTGAPPLVLADRARPLLGGYQEGVVDPLECVRKGFPTGLLLRGLGRALREALSLFVDTSGQVVVGRGLLLPLLGRLGGSVSQLLQHQGELRRGDLLGSLEASYSLRELQLEVLILGEDARDDLEDLALLTRLEEVLDRRQDGLTLGLFSCRSDGGRRAY